MRANLRYLLALRVLPPRVALFLLRARRRATRTADVFSLASSIRPAELAVLLAEASERKRVAELGTGTAWSTIALAVDDRERRVVTYDPVVRVERERYLALAGRQARARIEFRAAPDTDGPRDGETFDLLFIDSAHDRESVIGALAAWRDGLSPGGVVVFHDYGHPDYPGVRDAIAALELSGEERGGLFVWRSP